MLAYNSNLEITNMKKNILICSFFLIINLFFSLDAQAQLYIGGDFSRSHISYKSDYDNYFNDNYNVYGPVVGINVNGVGIEGFYQIAGGVNSDLGDDSDFRVYGAEFILELPASEMVDFIASLGFVKYEFEYTPSGGEKIEEDCEGVRFGLGFQLNLNKHIALRTMYHYSSINSNIDKFDNINELTAGFRIYF